MAAGGDEIVGHKPIRNGSIIHVYGVSFVSPTTGEWEYYEFGANHFGVVNVGDRRKLIIQMRDVDAPFLSSILEGRADVVSIPRYARAQSLRDESGHNSRCVRFHMDQELVDSGNTYKTLSAVLLCSRNQGHTALEVSVSGWVDKDTDRSDVMALSDEFFKSFRFAKDGGVAP